MNTFRAVLHVIHVCLLVHVLNDILFAIAILVSLSIHICDVDTSTVAAGRGSHPFSEPRAGESILGGIHVALSNPQFWHILPHATTKT
jgi:hypothetical protein